MDQEHIVATSEGVGDLNAIKEFLLSHFIEIFGIETMTAEKYVIYNDPKASCPMLITNTNKLIIRLAQSSLSYWAQTIYQLSHEMMHYVFRQHKADKELIVKWFEEITCEAVSLYFLIHSVTDWEKCSLAIKNPSFYVSIAKYLNDELDRESTDAFQRCQTVEELKKYDAEADRAGHRSERNKVYREIIKNPTDLKSLCDYPNYVNENGVTFDFILWIEQNNNKLIRIISEIQPVK